MILSLTLSPGPTRVIIRVAYAAGVVPYLERKHLEDYFIDVLKIMEQTGSRWTAHVTHGALLRSFKDVGGLQFVPDGVRDEILKWLVRTYLGEPGGTTSWRNVHHVFYSDTAAPLIREIISDAKDLIRKSLRQLAKDKDVRRTCSTTHIERRLEALLDLVGEG